MTSSPKNSSGTWESNIIEHAVHSWSESCVHQLHTYDESWEGMVSMIYHEHQLDILVAKFSTAIIAPKLFCFISHGVNSGLKRMVG